MTLENFVFLAGLGQLSLIVVVIIVPKIQNLLVTASFTINRRQKNHPSLFFYRRTWTFLPIASSRILISPAFIDEIVLPLTSGIN